MIAINKTRQTRVLNTISILAIGALLLVLFLFSGHKKSIENTKAFSYDGSVTIGQVIVPVSIADTDQSREQGLSGTTSLDSNAGKLFVFNSPSVYGFWMKDMNYPLDIIWIDKDFKIIAISKDLKPESYPEVFYPPSEVLYVLEVNGGFSTANNIAENQLVSFVQESKV